jgi:hypothetical protein
MTNNLEDAAAIASRFINNTNRNIFLTGKAGTGKTTFLRYIVEHTHKSTIVAAPTGIAAINAGGVTLHSLFQLPFGTFIPSNTLPNSGDIPIQLNTPDSLLRGIQMHATKRKLLREMDLLIIDEVSMLRADLLDAIDVTLRWVRRNKTQPFGGVQVLFIGDLFQLPPVVKQDEWPFLKPYYPDVYFFSAKALYNQQPVYIELDKIYRQTDDEFIAVLNHFRDNRVTHEDVAKLNSRYIPDFQPASDEGYIHLTTHNRKADTINRDALKELPGQLFRYQAEIENDFNEYLFPVDSTLELKEGAQVMFLKNDYSGEHRYFNGKIATVSSLSEDEIRVKFKDEESDIQVDRYIWENKKFTLSGETSEIVEVVAGTFSHYPIKLAWGITVHKSQGLTFEKAIIDVSSAFAPGQIYVALSRLVSLEGLVLSARVPFSGPPQDEALKVFVEVKKTDPPLQTVLPAEIRNFIRESVLKSFNFSSLLNILRFFIESHDKDETKSVKQKQKSWALKIEADFKPLKETADKFMNQLKGILNHPDENYLSFLLTRLEAAKGYFEPLIIEFSNRIHKQEKLMETERKAKGYYGELKDLERHFFKLRQVIYKTEELIRSAIQDTEFSKENLMGSSLYRNEKSEKNEKNVKSVESEKNVKNEKSEKNVKNEKNEKGVKGVKKEKRGKNEDGRRSSDISFDLYKEGKSIKEIAAERGCTVITIEGHLAQFVAKGELDVSLFVDPAKVAVILELAKELDTMNLGPYKERLGSDYSYEEIRFAMAHRLSMAK